MQFQLIGLAWPTNGHETFWHCRRYLYSANYLRIDRLRLPFCLGFTEVRKWLPEETLYMPIFGIPLRGPRRSAHSHICPQALVDTIGAECRLTIEIYTLKTSEATSRILWVGCVGPALFSEPKFRKSRLPKSSDLSREASNI